MSSFTGNEAPISDALSNIDRRTVTPIVQDGREALSAVVMTKAKITQAGAFETQKSRTTGMSKMSQTCMCPASTYDEIGGFGSRGSGGNIGRSRLEIDSANRSESH